MLRAKAPDGHRDRINRVFGVGVGRTGTQSLAAALRILGFPTVHYPWGIEDIREHRAAVDIPVAVAFRQLDCLFPKSRFILTTRKEPGWLESCKKHYAAEWREKPVGELRASEQHIAMVELALYGAWQFDRARFLQAKRRHEASVREYFRSRPSDLLVLDIPDATKPTELWAPLCRFLFDDEIIFPWLNQS